MRLRAAVIGLVLAGGVTCTPGVHADLDIAVGIGVSDVSLGEALLVGAIGEFFGLETHFVPAYRSRYGMDLPEVVSSLYLARLAGVSPHRAAGLHSRGHGYGRVAKELGIHPGTFNKMRKGMNVGSATPVQFEDAALSWFLSDYYGVPRPTVSGWRGDGESHLSILLALDLASKSGKPPATVMAERNKGGSHKSLAGVLGVTGDQLDQPSKPKGGKQFRPAKDGDTPAASATPTGPGKSGTPPGQGGGPGNGKGKGKGHNK